MKFDFRNPDYLSVYRKRAEVLEQIRADENKLAAIKVYYRSHIADFINDWGMTFDPRNADIGLPTTIPFLLFQKQRDWVDWIIERWRSREDGVTEKSRDMGISWLSVAIASSLWLFEPGVVLGFGSRKEEYVDKLGSPKSLFWKARQFIELLPVEFRPSNWEAPFMKIINHDNGSYIVGEAGDNIGRGDRTSIYFVDEAAFIERQDTVDAALSQTSNCKIYVSTPNGNGNAFYQKRMSGKLPIFTFHWRDDPRKDDAWYEKQKRDLDEKVVAQEIDIDYNSSTTDSWIHGAIIEEAQRYGVGDLEAIGPLVLGIDAAHFGDDESVITPRKGRVAFNQLKYKKCDGPTLAGHIIDYCMKSPDLVRLIVIELDGPGVSCFDQLKQSIFRDIVRGVHTGATVTDHRNYNLRAAMYRKLRDWFADGPVRIENDKELKSQLSSIKYGYKDGLLLLASKKDMKSKGFKSPDRADSLALTFAADPPENFQSINHGPKVNVGHPGGRRRT